MPASLLMYYAPVDFKYFMRSSLFRLKHQQRCVALMVRKLKWFFKKIVCAFFSQENCIRLKLMDFSVYSDVDFLDIDKPSSECITKNTSLDWRKPNIWSENMHFTMEKSAVSSIPMILTGWCRIRFENYKDYASKTVHHIYRRFLVDTHTHTKLSVITTLILHQVSFSFQFKF